MKMFKSTVSLMLALIMIFSCCSVALGAEESIVFTDINGETFNHYPQIKVSGFGVGCVKMYYEDDPEQKSLFWPFETERFITNLGNIGAYMRKSIENKQPNMLRTIVYNYLMDCFGMLSLKPDGSMMDGVTTEPVGVKYVGDGEYEVFYDCRYSPMHTAEYLHEAVEKVLEETGCEKVELLGSSFGANIVTAYMDAYEDELDKIDTVLLSVPSINGICFLGELLSGNFEVSAIGLCDFINDLTEMEIIPDLFYLMEEAGVLEVFLEGIAVPVLRKAFYEGLMDAAREFLGTLPTIWVGVPDEYFEDAMEYMYGKDYRNSDHTYADLIADMTYYHYEIANKAVEIYTEAEKNYGLDMALISKFGVAAIPLVVGENVMDDGLVAVSDTSLGATCATYGGKLPVDYTQQKYTEYNFMCPEWNIDASTGAFPFRTWYIKNLAHSDMENEDYMRLVDEILYRDLDVFTDSEWPQYLTVSESNPDKLEPLLEDEDTPETLYQKIWKIFKASVLFPKKIFDKLFGR